LHQESTKANRSLNLAKMECMLNVAKIGIVSIMHQYALYISDKTERRIEMCNFEIESKGETIYITTPYNPNFVAKVKRTGAKWDGASKRWHTDARNIEIVRGIMREVYGRDDSTQETVSVRIILNRALGIYGAPIVLFGKTVASASGRDSGARLGEGVAFERGAANSGGSVKNWTTRISENSIIVLHDVPKQAVAEKLNWEDDMGTFEIINNDKVDQDALRAEKDRLLARIAEIDSLLN